MASATRPTPLSDHPPEPCSHFCNGPLREPSLSAQLEPSDDLRLSPDAAERVRAEVEKAGGREVCFLARVSPDRTLVEVRAVARGNKAAVLAAARDADEGSVMVHNHPSGDSTPSRADIEMTNEVKDAGAKLGITLHDHLIMTKAGHSSFKDMGLL